MRNSFLTPYSSCLRHLQTLTFPLLPIPLLLLPPDVSPSTDSLLPLLLSRFFSSDSGIDLSVFHLHAFPVEHVLRNFLSAVLPHPTELPSDDVHAFAVGSTIEHIQNAEEMDNNTVGANDGNRIGIVQFESPQLEQFGKAACEPEREMMEILSKTTEFDDNSEMIHLAANAPSLHEVERSVYLVEDVPPDVSMDPEVYLSGAHSSLRKSHYPDTTFSQFELEEIIMGKFSGISIEDELLFLCESIETLDNTGKDENEVNWEELFSPMEIGSVSEQFLSKLLLESHMAHQKLCQETELLYLREAEASSAGDRGNHYGIFDIDSNFLVEPLSFEEFKSLDPEYFEIFHAVLLPKRCGIPGKCDESSLKDLNIKSFDELIVCNEIAMDDHNFKSIPVPVLTDNQQELSIHDSIAILLADLEPLPVSASDEIYLDWDLLGKDKGSCDIHATFQRMFSDIGTLRLGYDLQSAEGNRVLLDFVLSDDMLNGSTTESKVAVVSVETSIMADLLSGVSATKMLDDRRKVEGGKKTTAIDSMKVPLQAKSVAHFNELEFFLNPMKATGGTRSDLGCPKLDSNSVIPDGTCEDTKESSSFTSMQKGEWSIKLHVVSLPTNILTLIENFEKSFVATIDDLCLKIREFSCLNMDDMPSSPEEKLMDFMRILCKEKSFPCHVDNVASVICTLLAIKHMASCLCFFGIHALYEFVAKLLQKTECLRSSLGLLVPYIEETYTLARKEIAELHPSLSVIQEILKINASKKRRLLIVSEQALWWPLKSMLPSMDMLITEVTSPVDRSSPGASDLHGASHIGGSDVVQSECFLISHEHVSAAILSKQFDTIVEYGGMYSSSKVLSILPKCPCYVELHFLKLELDGAAKALCTGLDIPSNEGFAAVNTFKKKLEEMLYSVPSMEDCSLISMDIAREKTESFMPLPAHCISVELMPSDPDQSSRPDTTIIVNTQNFDTEMIISRRSTYQRILSLEKRGAQILERDFCLPVDIIISAATCLAWYNCRNIIKKATTSDEAASCVSLCVDNLAANVLTTLSFTFGSCIMVFEGESNFLATIAESCDELYAAAASLGIALQIFCSYSSELTEDIILDCIGYAMKFHKSLFPKLSESETIAESFLTKFPSINPLSALAILSSGAMLLDFLGWSEDRRICALQKFHVPAESVSLLSVLSRYGKREDSVSGMTDCSSSISSVPTSAERLECKLSVENKKRKYSESLFEAANDSRCHQSTRSNVDDMYNPKISVLLEKPDISDEQPPNMEELFRFGKEPDNSEKIDPFMASEPHFSWISRDRKLMDDGTNDRFLNHKEKSSMATSSRLPGHNTAMFRCDSDDFMGEVLDINDGSIFGEGFSSSRKATHSSFRKNETAEVPGIKSSKTVRRLSFENDTHLNFPTAEQIDSNSIPWSSVDNGRRGRQDRQTQHRNGGFIHRADPLKNHLEEGNKAEKPASYIHRLLSKEKGLSSYEGSPLRNAISSKETPGESPWTKEFLNQVREKIKLHRQYLPPDTSTPHSDSCVTTSKGTKRKSPSIYEYFKYQSGKTPIKLTGRMRQKQSTHRSTLSKKENSSSSTDPRTWTPVDKRARQTLSFATGGNGGQTKLVWNDEPSQSPANRFLG